MKKTKKLAALVLAMVMAFSLMAVTASAYSAEAHEHGAACCEELESSVMPRRPHGPCPVCLEYVPYSSYIRTDGKTVYTFDCPTCGTNQVVK